MPLGGIAGDMFAAALFSAHPELYQDFCKDLDVLDVDGLTATLDDRMSKGMRAKYFNVMQDTALKPPRTLAAVTEFLQTTPLAENVAEHAVGIFTLLAQAEAEVHGKTIDTIHFHEVSDWDSVVDIVAAAGIIARLDCPVWRIGELPLGGGTVKTAHGDISVPAPATLALLKGFQWHDDGESGERVTPTGAAIIAYLKPVPIGTSVDPAGLYATGSGCGTRELASRANILRVTSFSDQHMQGKKGRTATGLRIIASSSSTEDLIDHCFKMTSTIGVRYEAVQRFILNRSEHNIDGVSVKVVSRSDQVTAKTSSDDLSACASLSERRRSANAIRDEVLQKFEREE